MLLCSNPPLSSLHGRSPNFAAFQGDLVRSDNSRYLAVILGGLVMGLAVIFASLYTALQRPLAF